MESHHQKEGVELDQHGRAIKVPNVATDAIVIRPKKHKEQIAYDILLITRGGTPFKGHYAFPGGFVDYNEDPVDACIRELREECGIQGSNP